MLRPNASLGVSLLTVFCTGLTSAGCPANDSTPAPDPDAEARDGATYTADDPDADGPDGGEPELDAALDADHLEASTTIGDDGATPPLDAHADDAGDAGGTGTTTTHCTAKACPYVSCHSAQSAFPAPLFVSSSPLIVAPEEPITKLTWTLQTKPQNSTVNETGPDASSFSFTPDVPGVYRWCVQPTSATLLGDSSCCDYATVVDFAFSFDPANSTRSVEDVEFAGGKISFAFNLNQAATFGPPSFAASDPDWAPRPAGSAQSSLAYRIDVDLNHVVDGGVSDLRSAVTPDDAITFTASTTPKVVGDPTVLMATITLAETSVPDAHAAQITDFSFEAYAGIDGLVKARFAPEMPPASLIAIGSWSFFSTLRAAVRDDGNAPDQVAGDGWYTGRAESPALYFADGENVVGRTAPPGAYSVLVQPTYVDLSGRRVVGAYSRQTLSLK